MHAELLIGQENDYTTVLSNLGTLLALLIDLVPAALSSGRPAAGIVPDSMAAGRRSSGATFGVGRHLFVASMQIPGRHVRIVCRYTACDMHFIAEGAASLARPWLVNAPWSYQTPSSHVTNDLRFPIERLMDLEWLRG